MNNPVSAIKTEISSNTEVDLERASTVAARSESPIASQKAADTRQFQKTRSFSAVEETPDKKVSIEETTALAEFPFEHDFAHSRSEHLETQQQSAPEGDITPVNSKRDLSKARKSDALSGTSTGPGPMSSGDMLIMQFDYFANDQPMSLQCETAYSRPSNRAGGNSLLRKSGRDLTELDTEAARDGFDRTKANRMNSRPRLESFPITLSLNNPKTLLFIV